MDAGGGRGDGGDSERGGSAGGRGGRGFRGTAENAKTRMCNRWLQGECRFGDRCNFAHGDHELRALPPRPEGGYQGGAGPSAGGYAPRGRGGYAGYGGRSPGGRYGGGRGGYGQGGYDGGYNAGGNYGGGGGGYVHGMDVGMGQGGYDPHQPHAAMGGGMQGSRQEMWPAPIEGPNGWCMYRVAESNEPYFHNQRTNVTQWERPADWP